MPETFTPSAGGFGLGWEIPLAPGKRWRKRRGSCCWPPLWKKGEVGIQTSLLCAMPMENHDRISTGAYWRGALKVDMEMSYAGGAGPGFLVAFGETSEF